MYVHPTAVAARIKRGFHFYRGKEMIERNLGNAERLLRLLAGVLLFTWAWRQDVMNGVDWFVVAVAIALILNGIFSRCYLWYLLDVSTCEGRDKDCRPDPTCL
jgi:hypothetical protein